MSHEDCRAELREKTHQLLYGALKRVRVAALATALVPLGALAARPAVAQDCGSGGTCPTETPTVEATYTPTDVPPPTATSTVPFTSTPVDTATETPPPTETPTPTATALPCRAVSVRARFNRTPIAGGNCIWFNSVINPSGLGSGPTTVVVENQTVQFAANGQPFTVSVPRAVITFDANVTSATTTFDTVGNQWVTQVPLRFNRNVFSAGVMVPVVGGLPGGIRPVTWSGTFSSDADRARLLWEWAAAVYTNCDTDPAALGVKPVDGNARNPYRNSDDAGTPETIKRFVVGGARGNGRPNYTGTHSRTEFVRPCD
jgi:hypothetical protein